MIISKSIHVANSIISPFLQRINIPLCIYTISSLPIHLSVDTLCCFHVLAIVNGAAMNIGVHVSFRIKVFIFSGFIPRGGISGFYSSSIFSFFFKEFPCCFPQRLHKFTFPPTSDFLLVYIIYIVCTFILRLNSYSECITENSTKVNKTL